MHKTFFVIATFSLALAFTVISCDKDDEGGGGTDYADQADCTNFPASLNTYTAVVGPILDTYCAGSGCHDAITASEGIDLSDYAKSKNAFENKNVLCSVHHGADCVAMPQAADKLDDVTINILDCWAKNDYPE